MSKIGTAIVTYNSNGFNSAYDALRKSFRSYLSDADSAALDKMEATVTAKTNELEKFVKKLVKNNAFAFTLETKQRGRSHQLYRKRIAETDPNGAWAKNGHLFGLEWDIATYQNADVIVYDKGRLEADLGFKGLAKLIGTSINQSWGRHSFVGLERSDLKKYEKVFDINKVIDLSNTVDTEKARRKAERQIAAKGERVECADQPLLKQPDNYMREISYNEAVAKAEAEGLQIVLSIRSREYRGARDYIAIVNPPTDKVSEKAFDPDTIHLRSVYYGAREVYRRLGLPNKYLFVEATPTVYKRLKLWRDPRFVLEGEAGKQMLLDACKSVKPIEIISYSDGFMYNINSAMENIDKVVTEDDKKTKLYQRLAMINKVISGQNKLLEDATYEKLNRYSEFFKDFGVESPVHHKEVTTRALPEYPMLYMASDIYHITYDNDKIKSMFDYARLIEASQASA